MTTRVCRPITSPAPPPISNNRLISSATYAAAWSRAQITAGTGMTFAQYKAFVLSQRVGMAVVGNVQGGSAATAVTEVTNTNDSGAGSLRAAMTGGPDRWITFRRDVFPRLTERTINLTSPIQIPNPGRVTFDARGAFVRLTGFGIITADWTGAPPWVANVANDIVLLNARQASIASGNYDCLTCDGTDRLWMWHWQAGDGGDGNLDITLTGYGPNTNGFMTLDYVYAHDTQSSKNCLFGDQTELAPVTPPSGYGDMASPTSSYPGFNGGDNRLTICRSRFKDVQRNPILFNYWAHEYNNLYHGYTLEGPTVMGGNAQQHLMYNVIDGAGAGGNAFKGEFSWTFDYNDNSREYKWMDDLGNVYLNGATFSPSGDGRTNPTGTMFTIPYAYPDMVTISPGASATALAAARADTSRSNPERSGTIDCDGYYDLVV